MLKIEELKNQLIHEQDRKYNDDLYKFKALVFSQLGAEVLSEAYEQRWTSNEVVLKFPGHEPIVVRKDCSTTFDRLLFGVPHYLPPTIYDFRVALITADRKPKKLAGKRWFQKFPFNCIAR
jgi:hypothetical protein